MVERSSNCVFEDDLAPHDLWGKAASYELCLLLICRIGYREVCTYFPGRGTTWEDLFIEEPSLEKGIFHAGEPDFSALSKKHQRLNKKTVFQLKVKSNIIT